jgi:hypothetical protein
MRMRFFTLLAILGCVGIPARAQTLRGFWTLVWRFGIRRPNRSG